MTARTRYLLIGVAALWLVAMTVAIGRAVAGQDEPSEPDIAPPSAAVERDATDPNLPSPPRMPEVQADVGSARSDRTPEGAVEAATAYTIVLDGPDLFDPVRRERLIAELVAIDNQYEAELSLGEVVEVVSESYGLDQDVLDDPSFVWRVVPGGWQLHSYDGQRAAVDVWATGVVMVRGLPLVQPGWYTTHVELVWERGAWRVTDFTSTEGPQPPAVGGGAEADLVARLIREFQPYGHDVHDVLPRT